MLVACEDLISSETHSDDSYVHNDILNILPLDVIELIFFKLDVTDILSCSLCSLSCYQIQNQDIFWKKYCKEKGWDILGKEANDDNPNSIDLTKQHSIHKIHFKENEELNRLPKLSHWKLTFMLAIQLKKNWNNGTYAIETLVYRQTITICSIDSNGKYIVYGRNDGAIFSMEIGDNKSSTLLFDSIKYRANIIKIHKDNIYCAFIYGQLKRLDFQGQCIRSYRGYDDIIDKIVINDNRIICTGCDRFTKVWDLNSSELLHNINLHNDDIEMVTLHEDLILSSSWDGSLIMFNAETGVIIHNIQVHGEILCAKIDLKIFVTGSSESALEIWSTSEGTCIHRMMGHDAEIYCLTYNDEVIISGSADSTIRIWSFQGHLRKILVGHIGIVRGLYIDDFRLVSYGDQCRIIVWDNKKDTKMNILYKNPRFVNKLFISSTHLVAYSPDSYITLFSYW